MSRSRALRSLIVASVGLLAAGALSVVVVPGVAAAAPTAPAAVVVPTPPPLVWTACEAANLQAAGAECSMVTVPLDYEDESAGTVQVAISRVRHTSATYQGAVLANPGGPGGSGLRLALLGARVPADLAAQYDWIGFDPRGVGSSVPSLHCDTSYSGYDRPDYVATTPALRKVWLNRAAGYSQSCAAHNDLRLLDHMTTLDTVRDMESIRLALGRSQITVYGFSFGTYLAQVYASVFPTKVRRAVLDSTVDPRRVWYGANLDQDAAFDVTATAFFTWVAGNNATYGLGATEAAVEQQYHAALDRLRTAPQNDGKVGPDEWNDLFLNAGYYQSWWLYVAAVFHNAVLAGDDTGVTSVVPGPTDDDNGNAVYLATECTDTTTWPCTDAVVVAYLTDGTLPARKTSATSADKTCKALPQPTAPTPGARTVLAAARPSEPAAR